MKSEGGVRWAHPSCTSMRRPIGAAMPCATTNACHGCKARHARAMCSNIVMYNCGRTGGLPWEQTAPDIWHVVPVSHQPLHLLGYAVPPHEGQQLAIL